MSKRVNIWILIAITVALIVWDIVLATDAVKGNTISELIALYDQRFPIIRFAFGVLCGHWFWRQRQKKEESCLPKR